MLYVSSPAAETRTFGMSLRVGLVRAYRCVCYVFVCSILSFYPVALAGALYLYPPSLGDGSVHDLLYSVFVLDVVGGFVVLDSAVWCRVGVELINVYVGAHGPL